MSLVSGHKNQPSEAELQALRDRAEARRVTRRSCMISFLIVAVLIGFPLQCIVSSLAPVTLFPLRNTSPVRLSDSECGTWDTTVWPIFSSFSAGGIAAIDAASENDLWALTLSGNVLRGNGHDWQQVQTLKSADGRAVQGENISVRTAKDTWALGTYSDALDGGGLLFHWRGDSFVQVPLPGADPPPAINAVVALSEDDAWFVGSRGHIWHWNGKDIEATAPADPDVQRFDLQGISAVSPGDIWAVGPESVGWPDEGIALHWDGAQWSIARKWSGAFAPTQGNKFGTPSHVLAVSPDNVWVLGTASIAHWDGRNWEEQQVPGPGGNREVYLSSITTSPSGDIWALGAESTHDTLDFRPFAVRWNGKQWNVVPVPHPLKQGSFEAAKALPDRLVAAGAAFQDDELALQYAMLAEFRPASCP